MAPLVELRGVEVRFGAPQEGGAQPVPVLRGVDLEVGAGESIAVVGPSGSGKSTLLNVLGSLLPPNAGEVHFDGVRLSTMTPDQLAAWRNREVGFVFQDHHLLPQCTALENVLVPSLVRDAAHRRAAVARARALLDDVGLGDRREHRPAQLSGGECQRVAVVRALVNGPRLLLADEPTGSLDRRAADRLGELLCELGQKESTALVVVTHSQRLARRMQRALELRDGRLQPLGAGP